jgi:hypothetical protein
MKINPFNIEDSIEEWDAIHYETICMVIVEGTVSTDKIVQSMLWALCQIKLLGDGDGFNFSRTGNTIIIGKARNYISIDSSDAVN